MHLSIDVASTIFVGGLIDVLDVTLAHALIADAKRRHGVRGLQDPAEVSEGSSRKRVDITAAKEEP